MRVRHLTRLRKLEGQDTQWKTDDVPPRHCPIISKTKPIRAGWQWRSLKAAAGERKFILYAEVNIRRGDYKSILIEETVNGPSVIARYEFHSSHPGLHIHAHCERGGIEVGATGMGNLQRIPPNGHEHRRKVALSVSTFWTEARRFYGIVPDLGPLFDHA